MAATSRRCAGANLATSVRNRASADRRAAAGWVLPGLPTLTCTERRVTAATPRSEALFFTLMSFPFASPRRLFGWLFQAWDTPRSSGDVDDRPVRTRRDSGRPAR